MPTELIQRPFFVYGTLRRGLFNYQKHLEGRTAAEERGRLHGYCLYDAGGLPLVVGRTGDTNGVVGELMSVWPDQYDDVLRQLDELEGYDPADPTCIYVRVLVPVRSNTGPVSAWLYEAGAAVVRELTPDNKVSGGDWVLHQAEIPDVSARRNDVVG
ncbi:gamma-glutamylcyclotransferase family protein [Lentzea sp. BCCO 10_0061]|uniref:Gamma-glutamylcyclotransferase family protein n=1 Tax=Lentzea sokolovensis TaxID=3095429 RepID=A0ABU4UMC8_9PSEU|nr:gamma-glutamylcyclotransferase family protein [Lentzea sp. BCCO 10_0061]MDX8140571.1 gamma-glutamylcyclotransferase family protein [Lentzea sp. BCCO 10_0061]